MLGPQNGEIYYEMVDGKQVNPQVAPAYNTPVCASPTGLSEMTVQRFARTPSQLVFYFNKSPALRRTQNKNPPCFTGARSTLLILYSCIS